MNSELQVSNINIKLTDKQKKRQEKKQAKILEKLIKTEQKLIEQQQKLQVRQAKQRQMQQKLVEKQKDVEEKLQTTQAKLREMIVEEITIQEIIQEIDIEEVTIQEIIQEIAIEEEIVEKQKDDLDSDSDISTEEHPFEQEINQQNEEIIQDIKELIQIFDSEKDAIDTQIGGTQKGKNKKANREAQQKVRQGQKKLKEKLQATGKYEVVSLTDRYLLEVKSKPVTLKAFEFDLSYRGGDRTKKKTKISKKDYELDKKLAGRQYMIKLKGCIKQVEKLVKDIQESFKSQTKHFGQTVRMQISNDNKHFILSDKLYTKKDIQKFVQQILADEEFYEDFKLEVSGSTKFQVHLSDSLIGNTKSIGQNCQSLFENALVISPNTQTRCFANCLAILQLVEQEVPICLIYGQVKELQDKIARDYDMVGTSGVSFDKLVAICKEKNIRIFKIGEQIDCNGVIVSQNHCLVALENTPQNLAYCKVLENNYHAEKDLVMKSKDELLLKGHKDARPKLYLTYDSEYTKDSVALLQQKIQGEKLVVKELAYAFSYHIFMDTNKVLDKDAIVLSGEDSPKQFVEHINQIAKDYPKHDLVFYGHNSNKCDYPIFSKYMTKYFTKDQLDFSSKMAAICYRWNLNEQIIQFQDTLNIFPASTLKQILKNYGDENCQKLNVDHALINILNWEKEWTDQSMEEYCKVDVLGLSKALVNYNKIIKKKFGFPLLEHNNILSNSSLAQKAFFFNGYDQKNEPIYRLPKEYEDQVAQTYSGGSCQPFFIGHLKNIFGFSADINSAYTKSMMQILPTGPYYKQHFNFLKYEGQPLQFGSYTIYIKESCQTEKVIYYSEKSNLGIQQPCQIRNKITGKLSIEIEHMFSKGNTEIYLIDAILSKSCSRPLEKFVRQLYEGRVEQKKLKKECSQKLDKDGEKQHEALQLLLKNTMNSLYGKFALKCEKSESSFTTSQDVIMDLCKNGLIAHCEEKTIDGLKIYEFSGMIQQQSSYNNMMLAAFITAYTRIFLNQMQEKLVELGFTLMYSDTDSVYFFCSNTWPSKRVNEQLEKFNAIYGSETECGKCKFETEDDIGKSHLIWNKLNPDQEPMKYAFFDEAVVLCSKTYGLKSNLTGKQFLKAKGIPAWMIQNTGLESEDFAQQLSRCHYNGNQRQFTFEDYIKCNDGSPFQFNVIQTSVIKRNMYNDQDMKQTQKIIKTVACCYTQKKVLADGSLKYYKINGRADVDEEQLQQKWENNCEDEDYQIYANIEQIKTDHDLEEDGQKYKQWMSKQIIVRKETSTEGKESKNQFILFKNHQALVKYFNEKIKDSDQKNHHQLISKFNSPIQFDIDVEREKIDDDELFEEMKGQKYVDYMIKDAIKMFQFEGLEYEVINRSRENKISYHVRFAGKNWTYDLYRVLASGMDDLTKKLDLNAQKNIKNKKNQKWVKLPENTLLSHIDEAAIKNQLRITTLSEKFLFNPNNFPLTPKLTEDQLRRMSKVDTKYKSSEETIADSKIVLSHKKVCDEWLKENKLQHLFSYRSSKNTGKKQIINLYHKPNQSYKCQECEKTHDKDHCTFLEISFDREQKKQKIIMKCWKALQKK